MKVFIIDDDTNKLLNSEEYENINVRTVKFYRMINRVDIRVYVK